MKIKHLIYTCVYVSTHHKQMTRLQWDTLHSVFVLKACSILGYVGLNTLPRWFGGHKSKSYCPHVLCVFCELFVIIQQRPIQNNYWGWCLTGDLAQTLTSEVRLLSRVSSTVTDVGSFLTQLKWQRSGQLVGL